MEDRRSRLSGQAGVPVLQPPQAAVVHEPEEELSLRSISQPVRVALTGSGVSPGLAETMVVLGRTSTLAI